MKRWLVLLGLIGTCYGQIENPVTREDLGFNTNLNTLWTATNASNARSAVELGSTNSVTFQRITVDPSASAAAFRFGTNFTGLWAGADDDYRSFFVRAGGRSLVFFETNRILFYTNIAFDGGSSGVVAAQSRTNLGLGATWLTNTNVTNFRTAIELGQTNSPQFANLFLTNSSAGSLTNYILSLGSPTTGFTGVGGPVGAVNFRANGTAVWTASDTSGLELPLGASVSQPITLRYGGGSFGAIAFGGVDPATGRAISRTNLGLGGGITTTRTFVSYDGTNYTTNSVTISNGIITSWTQ